MTYVALAPPPPDVPPPGIVDQLTLNGSVPLEYYYVDDSNKGLGNIRRRFANCSDDLDDLTNQEQNHFENDL